MRRGSLDAEAQTLLDAAAEWGLRADEVEFSFDTDDPEHCPRCGDEWAWDGDSESSRVCGSCRADEAEYYRDDMMQGLGDE